MSNWEYTWDITAQDWKNGGAHVMYTGGDTSTLKTYRNIPEASIKANDQIQRDQYDKQYNAIYQTLSKLKTRSYAQVMNGTITLTLPNAYDKQKNAWGQQRKNEGTVTVTMNVSNGQDGYTAVQGSIGKTLELGRTETIVGMGRATRWDSADQYTLQDTDQKFLSRKLNATTFSDGTAWDDGAVVFELLGGSTTTSSISISRSATAKSYATGTQYLIMTTARLYVLNLATQVGGKQDTNRLALSSQTQSQPNGTTEYTFGETNDTSLSNTLNIDTSSLSSWSR